MGSVEFICDLLKKVTYVNAWLAHVKIFIEEQMCADFVYDASFNRLYNGIKNSSHVEWCSRICFINELISKCFQFVFVS